MPPIQRALVLLILAFTLACGGLTTEDAPVVPAEAPAEEPAPAAAAPAPAGPSPASQKAAAAQKCKRGCNSQCRGRDNKAKCVGQCRRACDR